MIGVQVENENARLFRTNETTVIEIYDDACVFVGSGSDIARYAVRPLIKFNHPSDHLTFDEAVLLATHTLRVAKDHDPYCGGESEFIALFDDGTQSGVMKQDILSTEKYSRVFDEIVADLFYSGLNERQGRLVSKDKLDALRREQKSARQLREELRRALLTPRRSTAQTSEDRQ